MAGRVTVIELARGLTGRAPAAATLEAGLADYALGGASEVFASLLGSASYRSRVVG